MTIEELRALLDHVKGGDEKFTARCPAHEDKENSLSVSRSRNGGIVVKCFADCAEDDICAALGIERKELFPPKEESTYQPRPSPSTIYDYRRADGELLYQISKGSTNWQRRPAAESGKWIYGLLEGDYVQRANGNFYSPKAQDKNLPTVHLPALEERPLYNLAAVLKALEAGTDIYIVEGEKDCESLRSLGLVATTNSGGAGSWKVEHSQALLSARRVFILFDNDTPGINRAKKIHAALPNSVIVELPGIGDLKKGADVTDWLQAGMGKKADLLRLSAEAWQKRETGTQSTPALAKPAAAANVEPVDAPVEIRTPYRVLGHDKGHYFLIPDSGQQVMTYSASSLALKQTFFGIADRAYWSIRFGKEDGGTDFIAAADHIIQACKKKGIFHADNCRGRGAWWDNGHTVLHLGNRLIVDGEEAPLDDPRLEFIYENGPLLRVELAEPLSDEGAQAIIDVCVGLSWPQEYGWLLAGWIALAPICGCLKWRPHVWLVGRKGTGKSTVLELIIATLLAPLPLKVQSNSSEAGIRSKLETDAFPVLFDEAEGEDARAQGLVQGVVTLARQASSTDGGSIVKGTPSGKTLRYIVRSMFLFSSISSNLNRAADASRFTLLTLQPSNDRAHWAQLRKKIQATCTPETAAALLSRMCRLIPVVNHNAAVLSAAIARETGDSRAGDQFGALIAGWYALTSSEKLDADGAIAVLSRWPLDKLTNQNDRTADQDEFACLNHLLEHKLQVPNDKGQNTIWTVAELIDEEWAAGKGFLSYEVDRILSQHGLRSDHEGLKVSNTNKHLKEIFKNTPWVNWKQYLERLPAAKKNCGPTTFANVRSRYTCIPRETLPVEFQRHKATAPAAPEPEPEYQEEEDLF